MYIRKPGRATTSASEVAIRIYLLPIDVIAASLCSSPRQLWLDRDLTDQTENC